MKIKDIRKSVLNVGFEQAGLKETWRKDITEFVDEKDKIPGYWSSDFEDEFRKRIFMDPYKLKCRSKMLFRKLVDTIKKDRGLK